MYDTTKPYKGRILELVKQTWETPYVSVNDWIVRKKFSFVEHHHSDGIGTKGVYHWKQRSFKNAVIDAMNMNKNDLALKGAIPYALIPHLFFPEDDYTAIIDTVDYLVKECKKESIAITGGETAIHNNIKGMEISITMLGFIENPRPNQFRIGDILIGIESSGLQSNGFSKIQEVFGEEYREDFIIPTYDYLDTILALDKEIDIHGKMHITGGAFTKLKDLLHDSDVVINRSHKLKPKDIFFELYKRGVHDYEMYKTFNCGIGFVIGIGKEDSNKCLDKIKDFKADIIGRVIEGSGKILIESQFDNNTIEYN